MAAAGFLPGGLVVVMGFRMIGDPAGFLAPTTVPAGWTFGGVASTAGLEAVLLSDEDGARGIRVRVAGLGPPATAGLFLGVVCSSLLGVLGAGCGAAPVFFLVPTGDGATILLGDRSSVLLTIGSEFALVVG